ncbi:MAG: hypothetical protein ACLUJG_06815 [Lawsonibacter sp.]
MIHAVSGKWRVEECLLELDMDTGRCRIAALPGMGEGLKLRWFTEDWLLVQGNGEILSDDFAQLINRSTTGGAAHPSGNARQAKRCSTSAMLTDGTSGHRHPGGTAWGRCFVIPSTSGGFCGRQTSPKKLRTLAGVCRNLSESALLPPGEGTRAAEVCR